MEKIQGVADIINPRYGMRFSHISTIYENSTGAFDMICKSFRFGYLQGMKAAKAEMKSTAKEINTGASG